jgi:serine protease
MFTRTLIATLVAAVTLVPGAVLAEPVSRLRLMLHPYAAQKGELPPGRLERLQAITGLALRPDGTSRAGALEFALAAPVERATLEGALRRLRADRSVLWAEVPRDTPSVALKRQADSSPVERLAVSLRPGTEPDWAVLLPRWEALTGVALTVDRRVGPAWVLNLPAAVAPALAQALAAQLQDDPAVRYADAVGRVQAKAAASDPLYAAQWALFDPVSGVNAEAAWELSTGASDLVVAVVDTGIRIHPDLEGRVLPGYDFVSDATLANDGDGRDPDAADPGDWTADGECGVGVPGAPSSWHGTFIAGQIAANADNGSDIAGLDRNARILPVRVLGKCGGSAADVIESLVWATGGALPDVPANPNPARVVNMSLGGYGPCPAALQEAIDDALGQGAVVVVAAGNETDDAANYLPANCSGVITVGAHGRNGERAAYSNFGARVDLSAPGGDGTAEDWIVSLSNAGERAPGDPTTAYDLGTSFAAPFVAGASSLLFARNPNLTPGQVQDALERTSRPFAPGTQCALGRVCGAGQLDAASALAATAAADAVPPPLAVPVIEYYRADADRYFITANPAEIAQLDSTLGDTWARTGHVFYAYDAPDPVSGLQPVCRFYGNPAALLDSHYFTADAAECSFVRTRWPGTWDLEDPASFYTQLPADDGSCPEGTLPVYGFFNALKNVNHRYTADLTVRRQMLNRGWVPEGRGENAVAFCAPPPVDPAL